MNTTRESERGFTIIEMLIVLAVAGMILMLVLQAIPALTRNGRNDRRRQDVATILEAVSHYELTNSGNFPVAADNFLQYSKLTFFDKALADMPPAATSGVGVGHGTAASYSNGTTDAVQVYNYQICDPNSATSGASTRSGAGYNDVVALYAIETAGGRVGKCQQL